MKGVKFLSYNFLFTSLHTLDMLLNAFSLDKKGKVIETFPSDCLERFKPVAEILTGLLSWRERECTNSILTLTAERMQSFFEQLRRKTYF